MSAVGDAPVKSAGRGGIKTVLYEDCPIRAHADGVLAALAGTSVPCDQGAAFGAAKSSGSGGRGILRYDGFRPVLTIAAVRLLAASGGFILYRRNRKA